MSRYCRADSISSATGTRSSPLTTSERRSNTINFANKLTAWSGACGMAAAASCTVFMTNCGCARCCRDCRRPRTHSLSSAVARRSWSRRLMQYCAANTSSNAPRYDNRKSAPEDDHNTSEKDGPIMERNSSFRSSTSLRCNATSTTSTGRASSAKKMAMPACSNSARGLCDSRHPISSALRRNNTNKGSNNRCCSNRKCGGAIMMRGSSAVARLNPSMRVANMKNQYGVATAQAMTQDRRCSLRASIAPRAVTGAMASMALCTRRLR